MDERIGLIAVSPGPRLSPFFHRVYSPGGYLYHASAFSSGASNGLCLWSTERPKTKKDLYNIQCLRASSCSIGVEGLGSPVLLFMGRRGQLQVGIG
jgi:hypothetical protein